MPGRISFATEESTNEPADYCNLIFSDPDKRPFPPAIIIAAHPDDEVIGAGGFFRDFSSLHFIHTTDGSPHNMLDAFSAGYVSRRAYADARRRELFDALTIAGIPSSRCFKAGIADQEASINLALLIRVLVRILRKLRPAIVLTPAYEGGHPDHDATALAAHAATALLRRETLNQHVLVEYALYHAGPGGIEVSEFLPVKGAGRTYTAFLRTGQRLMKERMVRCFRTQSAVLSAFQHGIERFRLAPSYDFSVPPHAGRLYYENFDWGMTGAGWRNLASGALRRFGLGSRI
jgi:N-acetylglucosamine malate deacetylase 2